MRETTYRSLIWACTTSPLRLALLGFGGVGCACTTEALSVSEGRRWWRRGQDLNLRGPEGPSGFQDQRLRPLSHLSVLTRKEFIIFCLFNQDER